MLFFEKYSSAFYVIVYLHNVTTIIQKPHTTIIQKLTTTLSNILHPNVSYVSKTTCVSNS